MLRGFRHQSVGHRINLYQEKPSFRLRILGYIGLILAAVGFAQAAKAQDSNKNKGKTNSAAAVPEWQVADLDISKEMESLPPEEGDDFHAVRLKLAREQKSKSLSRDQMVEIELEKIRLAEEKKRKEEERQAQLAEEQRRREGLKRYKQDRLTAEKLRKGIDTDDIDVITDEDVNWPGLR